MLNEFWGKLKSGSDIRGIAMEDDNNSKIDLTNDIVEKICISMFFQLTWKYDYFI